MSCPLNVSYEQTNDCLPEYDTLKHTGILCSFVKQHKGWNYQLIHPGAVSAWHAMASLLTSYLAQKARELYYQIVI